MLYSCQDITLSACHFQEMRVVSHNARYSFTNIEKGVNMAGLFRAIAGMIPWADVARSAPAIIAATKDLIDGAPKTSAPREPVDTGSLAPEEAVRLLREENAALRASVVELQADSRRQADVIARLAEQADRLAEMLTFLNGRLRVATIVAVIALIAAVCGIVLAVRF